MHSPNSLKVSLRAGILVFIVAPLCLLAFDEPPRDLAKRVAARESETEEVRSHYTYRQSVRVEDFNPKGGKAGEYGEVRDILFSPEGKRIEQEVKKPWNRLTRIIMTPEDFRDIREVHPMLLTKDTLFIYETKYRGEETADGVACWLLQVRPRQILEGQRLFDGTLWVDQRDFSIIRSEGQAVPQILSTKTENLFPRFTTIRMQVDGKYWFPGKTFGDDRLPFKSGPERLRVIIDYANYMRFSAESTIRFGEK